MDKKVIEIFNDMEQEYDEIKDLWYSWLFSRLHYIVSCNIISKWKSPKMVLDIGCGTGYQSFIYAKIGSETIGIDISDRLLAVALKKNETINSADPLILFEPAFNFVIDYNSKINKLLTTQSIVYKNPVFEIGDAQNINYPNDYFDHINCCGSTFSFVPDYGKAIFEMKRCLKPFGTFIVEVEGKNNFDLFWTLLDASILFGKLEYDTSFKEAWSMIFGQIGKHILVEYPFGDIDKPVYMNIRLFRKRKLIKEFKKAGLQVDKCYSIHSLTNLIPSTKLDTNTPKKATKFFFNILSKLEEKLPFYLPGCSIVLIGHKI